MLLVILVNKTGYYLVSHVKYCGTTGTLNAIMMHVLYAFHSKGMSNMKECFTDEERLTMYHLLEEYLGKSLY